MPTDFIHIQPDRSGLELSAPDYVWQPLPYTNPEATRILFMGLNVPGYYSHPIRLLSLMVCEDADLNQKFDPRFFETETGADLDHILALVQEWRPAIIGCSINIWNCLDFARFTAALRKMPSPPILIGGGQEVTNSVYNFLEKYPHYDFIIDGEGEVPLKQLLTHLDLNNRSITDPSAVSGLVYRNENEIVRTHQAEVLPDLDALPSPVLANLIPDRTEHKDGLGIMLEGTRACPFRCAFCFEGDKTTRTRFASLERLRAEAIHLSKSGVRHIHMLDPILCASRRERLEGLEDIFQTVNTNNRTFISVEAYADLITPEVADALRLGSVLDIGLQSINAQTTRAIQRPFKRDKWLRGIRLLRERNIAFNVYLISALPYETLGTFLQGIQFTLQERPLRIFFNELCLLNGTMLRRNAEQFGYEYDRDPPYFVHGNRWMPVPVLKFVQALAKVVERNYSNKAGVLLNSLPWMTKTNRYIGAEDSIVRHNLQDGIPTTAANTSAEQIELRAGPSVERRLLLQSAAQAMLAGFDRIILSADFANLNDAETIHNLVKRGVLHFRVPLNLERYQFDAEYNRMSTNALLQLTREYRIASGPQVRPIIEIDIQNGEHTDALRSVTDRLANRLGIIWNTYADEFLEAEHNRELVYDLMCSITPHRSWVRMSRNAMQYCLRRFDELPGEHDIGADAQRILDDMQSLELIGDGYVQTDFSRTPGLERANR